MSRKVEIVNDVFDVAARIKNIDCDYEIFYDTTSQKYELHCNRFKPSLQLVFPYRTLDSRAVKHVYLTKIDNIIEEIKRIDEYNDKLNRAKIDTILDESTYKIENLFKYLHNGGSEIPFYGDI